MSRKLSQHDGYYRRQEEAKRRHEIMMDFIEPGWREREAINKERSDLLRGFIHKYSYEIKDVYGAKVWGKFWHDGICYSDTPGEYYMSLDKQKKVLFMVEELGVKEFFRTFIAAEYDLTLTIKILVDGGLANE